MKTDLRNGENVTQSLNLHADDNERWLGFHNGDVSIKLDTDVSKLTQAGSAEQQAAALDQWSDQNGSGRDAVGTAIATC